MADSILFSSSDLASLVATLLEECRVRWCEPEFKDELGGSLAKSWDASPEPTVVVRLKNGQKFQLQISEVSCG